MNVRLFGVSSNFLEGVGMSVKHQMPFWVVFLRIKI